MGFHSVEGKLTRASGNIRNVELNVITRELSGGEDEIVYQAVLVSADVPDGDYILEYFCFGSHRDPVRVKYGRLVAR
jgi:hypothetical protein